MAFGTAVHRALEGVDMSAEPRALPDLLRHAVEERLAVEAFMIGRHDVNQRLDRLVVGLARGRCCERLREVGDHVLARELPLLLPATGDEAVAFVSGSADLVYSDPQNGRLVVADYKTDIVDDDSALLSITANDAVAAEPADNGQLTVSLDSGKISSTDTVISYTLGGSATNGTDYNALSGSVTITSGSSSAVIDVTVIDEQVVESDEDVIVTVTGITSGDADITIDGGADNDTVNIADNDSALVSIAATIAAAAEPATDGQGAGRPDSAVHPRDRAVP